MFTNSGIGMAMGIAWCVTGILLILIAIKIKKHKNFRALAYGFSLTGFFMGASYLLDNIHISYVGTNLALICVALVFIELVRKK